MIIFEGGEGWGWEPCGLAQDWIRDTGDASASTMHRDTTVDRVAVEQHSQGLIGSDAPGNVVVRRHIAADGWRAAEQERPTRLDYDTS